MDHFRMVWWLRYYITNLIVQTSLDKLIASLGWYSQIKQIKLSLRWYSQIATSVASIEIPLCADFIAHRRVNQWSVSADGCFKAP